MSRMVLHVFHPSGPDNQRRGTVKEHTVLASEILDYHENYRTVLSPASGALDSGYMLQSTVHMKGGRSSECTETVDEIREAINKATHTEQSPLKDDYTKLLQQQLAGAAAAQQNLVAGIKRDRDQEWSRLLRRAISRHRNLTALKGELEAILDMLGGDDGSEEETVG